MLLGTGSRGISLGYYKKVTNRSQIPTIQFRREG
jgi:hypothetical protein